MATWVTVGRIGDIAPGKVAYAEVDGQRLAICNADGVFYAVDDVCSHDGGSLDQGELQGTNIECPRHGARFDIRTGKVTALPAIRPIKAFPVRVDGNEIQVDLQ